MERASLLARIDQSQAQITLICAPAGFGKTTLMQQLCRLFQSRRLGTVWLRLDEADNDLGHFLQSLMAAIHVALPEFTPLEFAGIPFGPTGSAQGLAADVLDRISLSDATIALFLDDLELISDQTTWDFLQRLLADLGPHHRVVMGSRTSPLLALGRMRAHGLLLEFTQADLRFTEEETDSFLGQHNMTAPEAVHSLQQRTEGWPAALQLAAITFTAKGRAGTDWLERFSGSSGSVADYLAQEVLDSRPLLQRNFLLRSNALLEFSAEMCDAALGRNDSSAMIAQLQRDNLLLSSVEAGQHWYRYHPLFSDFLRSQLERETAGETCTLHRAAALWAAEQGLTNEAVTHALASRDHALAARLLESSAMDMVHSGRVAEAARIIATLPEAELIGRPALLRAGAFAAVFAHRYADAARHIETLECAAGTEKGAEDDQLFGMRLMLLAWTDRIPEMYESVAGIRAETVRFSPFTTGLASNASAYGNIALGRHVEAERDLARARQACEPIHALYVLNYSACFAAAIELSRGNTAQAKIVLDTAMNRAIADGQRHGSAGAVVATHLAELRYEINELDACQALVNDYLPIVVETGLPDHLIMLHRLAARLHFDGGRREAGYALLAELNEIGNRRGIARLSAASWLERAYAALRCHDANEARHSLALGAGASVWQGLGKFQLYANELEDPLIARVRLELVFGDGERALPLVESALQAAESTHRQRRVLRLMFLQAQIFERLGRRREAIEVFDNALTRAAGCGLVRTLADENWATERLVKRSLATTDPKRAGLLQAFEARSDPLTGATENLSANKRLSRLSNRELQVLRLISRGHSNKAIARELFLSENTIETHLRRVYEKLGTHNRTEAAALISEAGRVSSA